MSKPNISLCLVLGNFHSWKETHWRSKGYRWLWKKILFWPLQTSSKIWNQNKRWTKRDIMRWSKKNQNHQAKKVDRKMVSIYGQRKQLRSFTVLVRYNLVPRTFFPFFNLKREKRPGNEVGYVKKVEVYSVEPVRRFLIYKWQKTGQLIDCLNGSPYAC